ncbi:MAG: c-type cytochrome [Pseudomonadota bacterium]
MRFAAALIAVFLAMPAVAEPVAYTIVDGSEIPDSLTGTPGSAEDGRVLYFDMAATGCSGCHGSPSGPGAQAAAGEAAPSLSGVGARLNEGAIRLWIVAPRVLAPETTMPGYYSAGQRMEPEDPRFGMPRLTAREIEHLVAYLMEQRAQ